MSLFVCFVWRGTYVVVVFFVGALESQLEKVQKVKEKVNGPMREDLKKVDELAMECDKLKIVVNEKTPHTAFSLRAAHEQLSKTVGEEESSINSQILAKKVSGWMDDCYFYQTY